MKCNTQTPSVCVCVCVGVPERWSSFQCHSWRRGNRVWRETSLEWSPPPPGDCTPPHQTITKKHITRIYMYIVPFTIIIRTVQFSSTKKYSLALNYCMAPLKNALNACTLRQLQYQSKTSSYSNVSTGVKVTPLLKRLLPLVTNYSDMQRDSLSQQPLTLDTHWYWGTRNTGERGWLHRSYSPCTRPPPLVLEWCTPPDQCEAAWRSHWQRAASQYHWISEERIRDKSWQPDDHC